MDSCQIDRILRKNPVTCKCYEGCFPADKIPTKFQSYPRGMVVNTDVSNMPGEHWVAIYIPNSHHVEFYDSLCEWPSNSPEINQFLSRFKFIKHNGIYYPPIQSPLSKSCGEHVIYFLHMRCKTFDYDAIMRRIFSHKTKADVIVKNFLSFLRKKIGI
jgi:hypothetical protein